MQTKSSLLDRLSQLFPDSSKNSLRSWILEGRISVDGKVAKNGSLEVSNETEIEVGGRKKFLSMGLKIVFEDEVLVIVDKPEGLLSVAIDTGNAPSVHSLLKREYPKKRVFPVHRLDRETSGLLLFAKDEKVWKDLKRLLEKREIKREYLALVQGNPGKGTWRSYLHEGQDHSVSVCSSDRGKEAITHFETVETKQGLSLIAFKLESGRKHQIRVQASMAGFPLLGDTRYGGHGAKRMYLHAARLTFVHPVSGKPISLSSPSPWEK